MYELGRYGEAACEGGRDGITEGKAVGLERPYPLVGHAFECAVYTARGEGYSLFNGTTLSRGKRKDVDGAGFGRDLEFVPGGGGDSLSVNENLVGGLACALG